MARKFSIETVISAVDKVTRPVRRMSRSVTRAAGAMNRAFIKLAKTVGRLGNEMLSIGGSFAKFGAAGAAGAATGLVLLNKATVEAQQLANATGLSVENLEALTAAIKPAGFNLDNVNDLAEEMNNKFGEIATVGAPKNLQEGLKALNLNARELNKVEPDVRFRKIADAILAMENQTDALSAADKIFGGEANKVFGVLRNQAKTTGELIERYRELNFLTEGGRAGAHVFNTSLTTLLTTVRTLAQEVAGLAGDRIAPLLDRMREWLQVNRDLVGTKVEKFVGKLGDGVEKFGKFLSDPATKKGFKAFVDGFQSVAPSLEGVIKSLEIILDVVGKIFAAVRGVGTFLGETAAKGVLGAGNLLESTDAAVRANPMALASIPTMGMGYGPVLPVAPRFDKSSASVNGEIVVKAAPGTEARVSGGSSPILTEQTGAF